VAETRQMAKAVVNTFIKRTTCDLKKIIENLHYCFVILLKHRPAVTQRRQKLGPNGNFFA
jgi:hypothetical protein